LLILLRVVSRLGVVARGVVGLGGGRGLLGGLLGGGLGGVLGLVDAVDRVGAHRVDAHRVHARRLDALVVVVVVVVVIVIVGGGSLGLGLAALGHPATASLGGVLGRTGGAGTLTAASLTGR